MTVPITDLKEDIKGDTCVCKNVSHVHCTHVISFLSKKILLLTVVSSFPAAGETHDLWNLESDMASTSEIILSCHYLYT